MTVLSSSKTKMFKTSVLADSVSGNSSLLIDGELYLHLQKLGETKRFLVLRVPLPFMSHLITSTLSRHH